MKKVLVGFLIIFCSLAFIGCSQDQEGAAPEKTITIGIMPDVESIPFIIAEKNGYFAREGVNVKIEHFKSAKDRDSALQSGKLDGVITDIVAVVFANEGGFDLKMIARNDGNILLMAGKDSGITSVADIKGKDVGLSTNTIMEYTFDKMLEEAQVDPKDVNKVAIPQLPTRLEMLQGGKIDACILPEPLAGLAVKDGAAVLNSTDAMEHKAGAIAFTGQSLKDNPEAIKAIFRAYNEAVAYLSEEPVSTYADFIIENQGFPPAVKDSLQLPQYSQAVLPDEEIVSEVVQWMQAKDLIKGSYEYKDLVDDIILK